jgi:hypothetical protein
MIEVDGLRMEKTIKDRIARWKLRFSSFDCIYLYTRCSKRSCNPLWLKGQRQSHKRLKHHGVTFVIYPLKLKKNICADLTWLFLSMAIEHAMAALPFRWKLHPIIQLLAVKSNITVNYQYSWEPTLLSSPSLPLPAAAGLAQVCLSYGFSATGWSRACCPPPLPLAVCAQLCWYFNPCFPSLGYILISLSMLKFRQ